LARARSTRLGSQTVAGAAKTAAALGRGVQPEAMLIAQLARLKARSGTDAMRAEPIRSHLQALAVAGLPSP
jgi:hypothetical protein